MTADEALARRVFLFINKAWGYGDPQPDHYFLALNYRMSELQSAAALAQLDKLDGSVNSRIAAARRMDEKLAGIKGSRRRSFAATTSTSTGSTACASTAK
jgi:dTDP-4-amino-4,6-dideoxygalactose transaminase